MKRKIAILLATIMTAAVLPMNVMASSSNSINKTKTVSVDDFIDDIYLKIQPNDAITSGESIEITVKNAEFVNTYNDEDYKDDNGKYHLIETYSKAVTSKGKNLNYRECMDFLAESDELTVFDATGIFSNDNSELPYYIERRSKNTVEVKLFPISTSYAGKDNVNGTKPYYYIPINLEATEEGDIQITVDANETSISGGGTYTIATSTDTDGSTTTTISEVNYFEDDIYLDDITIKENVKGTFDVTKNNGRIKLRLSGGFVFSNNQDRFSVTAGTNADDTVSVTTYYVDDDTLEFDLPSKWSNTEKATSIIIHDVKVVSDDDDKWGDVNITFSGAGITKETLKVAERADFGFQLTLEEEVPTLYAGRTYVANSDIDEEMNEAAEVKFKEMIENTYIGERALQFTVPDGIKIFGYEINDKKYFDFSDAAIKVKEDGTVLEIGKGVVPNTNETSEFKLKLYISADADFEGDVVLSAKGAGVGEGVIDDVVIAKVATPITLSATPTVTNMGYQAIATSDIKITEATDGILLKDGEVVLDLDAAFGGTEIGFSDSSDLTYEITGDLQIKNFKVGDYKDADGKTREGVIRFTIDKTSYTEPSTITIKNVSIGSTRSVPFGAYDLKLLGDAVVNNYVDNAADYRKNWDKNNSYDYPAEIDGDTAYDPLAYFDTTDSYSMAEYLTIKTVTGTFDDVVEVSIGETTCTVNGEAHDMGVAPYIQTSSNSTMVPLRFVSVALGVDSDSLGDPDASDRVVWNAATKTVTLYYGQGTGQKIVQFTAGSNNMIVDGNPIAMDYGVVAEITDSRMFVPFRALGNALGIKVQWNADTKTATYSAY